MAHQITQYTQYDKGKASVLVFTQSPSIKSRQVLVDKKKMLRLTCVRVLMGTGSASALMEPLWMRADTTTGPAVNYRVSDLPHQCSLACVAANPRRQDNSTDLELPGVMPALCALLPVVCYLPVSFLFWACWDQCPEKMVITTTTWASTAH